MGSSSLLGIILMAIGAVFLLFGLHVLNQVIQAVAGEHSSNTIWFITGGIALIIAGVALFLNGRPKS